MPATSRRIDTRRCGHLGLADLGAEEYNRCQMALARFGIKSDVYLYDDVRGGHTCERCKLADGSQVRLATAQELRAHLRRHIDRGDRVPDDLRAIVDATDNGP